MKRITPEDFLWADVALQAKAKIEKRKTATTKRGEGNSSTRNHISEGRIAKLQLTKDLVRVKQEMNGPEPTQLTQVAKAMVLCGLPYRQTKERTIERRSRQGDGSLITVTFQAMLSSVPLPYGSDRNLFHWATDRSIKSGTPFVPWDTATEFLTDMQQTDGGRNYARLRESYRRIAGLSITVERTTGNRDQALIMPIMERSNLPRLLDTNTLAFPEKNEDELLPTGILFSNPFFQELSKNHVPFPWPILRTLARKPQMLDYMMFLHWRTFAARSESLIEWEMLRQQMWQEDTHDWRIFQPAIALLLLDRHTRGVDPAPERVRTMELILDPEPDGGKPERKALLRHHPAGVHENAAGLVVTRPTVIPCLLLAHDADRSSLLPPIDELRRVVENQHRGGAGGQESFASAGKVSCQNLLFTDPLVQQEAIGSFRARPILTGKRDTAADPFRGLSQQRAEPLVVQRVPKLTPRNLTLQPSADLLIRCVMRCFHTRSPLPLTFAYKYLTGGRTFKVHNSTGKPVELWVIKSKTGRLLHSRSHARRSVSGWLRMDCAFPASSAEDSISHGSGVSVLANYPD